MINASTFYIILAKFKIFIFLEGENCILLRQREYTHAIFVMPILPCDLDTFIFAKQWESKFVNSRKCTALQDVKRLPNVIPASF
jgi:hypothetical protein